MIFRELKKEEAFSASEIEKECLSTAWSEAQIRDIPNYAVYIGAFEGETLCGIGSMYVIADGAEILNIAVSEKYRKRGIGKGIMEKLISDAFEKGAEIITLEVANDNKSAISLYEKCGFTEIGLRKGFYSGKDALTMRRLLNEDTGN